jgi:opacity protein-like surface antigen
MLSVAAALTAAPALAKDIGWYAGGGIGYGRGTVQDSTINDFAASVGINPAANAKDIMHTAFKVFVGYSMNQYLGFEGGYFDLGSRGWSTLDANTGGTLAADSKTIGINLDVVGSLPLGNWRLFARGGGYYGRSKLTFSSDSGAPIPATSPLEEKTFNWKVGAGVGYEFASNVAFRAEWERYRVDVGSGDNYYVDVVSGSLLYRF